MIILIFFAFLAGIVTILSPCILPILPVVLATSVTGENSKKRPYGIVTGFILSFTFFTLFLSTIVKVFGISADSLRSISILVIAGFGLSLLIPRVQLFIESLFARLANFVPASPSGGPSSAGKTGFGGGVLIGLSLGLLWTPCVGPILASVISLAITGSVNSQAVLITLAYSLGTAIPMFVIIQSGQKLFTRLPWLLRNTANIQKAFGVIMIATAIGIYQGVDRTFQTYILTKFPQYGSGLTRFEDRAFLKPQLEDMKNPGVTLRKKGSLAPELIAGGQWLNSEPLTLSQLKGQVVLLDFWTYTCINCQRTLPYLKSWDEKYRDKGLVIIGVHAPEFEFEKSVDNVKEAVADFGLKYPIMQDNNFATWRAYKNNYWPAKYLVDREGNIRYTHFGEGDYDETESAIQELLAVQMPIANPSYETYGRTPETYLGSLRSGDESYLRYQGQWVQSEEYSTPSSGSRLTLKFDAMSVYLVMRHSGSPATVKVYLDGTYVKDVIVTKDMLYTLVDLDTAGRHTLELEFLDSNAQLFAFTFG